MDTSAIIVTANPSAKCRENIDFELSFFPNP